MSELTNLQLLTAAVHFILTLVWISICQSSWRFRRTRRPQSHFLKMLPWVAAAVAATYGLFTFTTLIPASVREGNGNGVTRVVAFHDCMIFVVVAFARHMAWYFAIPERDPPTLLWRLANYGSSAVMCMLALTFVGLIRLPMLPPHFSSYHMLRILYQLVLLSLVLLQLARVARPGVWKSGGAWVARRADVIVIAGALVSLVSWLFLAASVNFSSRTNFFQPTVRGTVLDAIAGFGFAAPLAVRTLGAVVRGVLMVTVTMLVAGFVCFGLHAAVLEWAGSEMRPLIDFATLIVLVILLEESGQKRLRGLIDQIVLRRSRERREQLHTLLLSLSPDAGVHACCQRFAEEAASVMQLSGAAIVVPQGDAATHGNIVFAPMERLWRSRQNDFPPKALVGNELRALPGSLLQALNDTNIVGIVPITSPRRRWGLLLFSTGLLAAAFSDEDEQVLQNFADQFAIVLDEAELLERTVAVERSLAHAEKLAAIGEMAARVAHEIRNPVTAARSLAQQLSREPTSPLNVEHAGLILAELERVERQVAALLRFARREEYQFEAVDVGELMRDVADSRRTQMGQADVTLALNAGSGIVVRADRDKLRQLLLNLIDNAVDALSAQEAPRALSLALTGHDGHAALEVRDNGPGVPADALPRLFEPFFSLKAKGTGLGLAIAKRTVEAHCGRIDASLPADGGFRIEMTFPLAHPRPNMEGQHAA